MYYIETTSSLDSATQTVFYSTVAGRFANQPRTCGIEEKSTLLRGYIMAAITGFKRIDSLFGQPTSPTQVDILIPDSEIADTFRQQKSKSFVGAILHADNDELWAEYFRVSRGFQVRFVSHPGESQHIAAIWKWSCDPPMPAELPAAAA